jgi:ATP-dependent RNA helicase DDX24/MAK5
MVRKTNKRKITTTSSEKNSSSSMEHQKQHQQQGGWSSLQWRPLVDAATSKDQQTSSSKRKRVLKYNHYDTADADPNELEEVSSNNDMGMLAFGIEVVDANSYSIQRSEVGSGGVITAVLPTTSSSNNTLNVSTTTATNNVGSKEDEEEESEIIGNIAATKSAKKKKKKKKKIRVIVPKQDMIVVSKAEENIPSNINKKDTTEETSSPDNDDDEKSVSLDNDKGESIVQSNWNAACGYGVLLHPILCQGLSVLNYNHPTPIQACTLPAAILGRRNIVGASPTGSGKTLSYALPILHSILTQRDEHENQQQLLQALIICPTRELTNQVQREIQTVSLSKVKCISLVGGLSSHKQDRLLLNEKNPPEIIVATPGRLWELISLGTYETTLNNMSKTLQFLVIDEADRMLCQGSFPQLKSILNFIQQQPNKEYEDADDDDDDYDELSSSGEQQHSDDKEDGIDERNVSHQNFLPSLSGVRGETHCELLSDDILAHIEEARKKNDSNPQRLSNNIENSSDDNPTETINANALHGIDNSLLPATLSSRNEASKVNSRQTFVYSATLMLPSTSTNSGDKGSIKKKRKDKTDVNKSKPSSTTEGVIAGILEMAGATGQTKIVDLTSANKAANVGSNVDVIAQSRTTSTGWKESVTLKNSSSRLPPGLSLYEAKCTQKHKDTQCYAFLTTTKEGSSGPALVFCNSIAAVKRVSETLKVLGLPARPLHAQMVQKARFESVESLRQPNSRAIVVATDVAARGLDIPTVASIIHYDTARGVDTFIHRAGRTARGVDGQTAFGTSFSLVSPSEEINHSKICEALVPSSSGIGKKFDTMHMDGRLIAEAHTRVSLAYKIYTCENAKSIANKEKSWFQKMSRDADIDLENDDELVHEGLAGNKQKLLEAKRARIELQKLLARPMRKQNFGKFLSGPGLTDAVKAEAEVAPYIVQNSKHLDNNRKKKKRKMESQ